MYCFDVVTLLFKKCTKGRGGGLKNLEFEHTHFMDDS